MNLQQIEGMIPYATHSWNPMPGCSRNCPFCYAKKALQRAACELCWQFVPHVHPERYEELLSCVPARARKPSRRVVFLSCGDVFDPGFTDIERDVLFFTLRLMDPGWWTFLILTKNADGLRDYVQSERPKDTTLLHEAIRANPFTQELGLRLGKPKFGPDFFMPDRFDGSKPNPNLWLGVSVTNKFDLHRIPFLTKYVPESAVGGRWASFEPILADDFMFGPTDFDGLDQVVVGPLSGEGGIIQRRPSPLTLRELVEAFERSKVGSLRPMSLFFKNHTLHDVESRYPEVVIEANRNRALQWWKDFPNPPAPPKAAN